MPTEFKPIHFNPLPPWGGRQPPAVRTGMLRIFQSTPSVGRETMRWTVCRSRKRFQSTPSVGRETQNHRYFFAIACISIHSLRGEGDSELELDVLSFSNFNPLPPWGGRLQETCIRRTCFSDFNPLPPWGGRLVSP